uniref:Uncharacterized protein n=1 Tax=Leersia perrieri TaxID=77586 RepID=A0A0D9W4D5_9ORYZ
MVPARSQLQLAAAAAAEHGGARCDAVVVTETPTTKFMAQEPTINHHHHSQDDPPKPPPTHQPPPPEEEERRRELIHDDHRREPPPTQRLQLQIGGDLHHHQLEAAGTSGNSGSGGSSSNGGVGGGGDWLRLGLASDPDLFHSADERAAAATATTTPPPRHNHHQQDRLLVLPGMPPAAMVGIPQASIPPHMPRAAPPWLPPWSPGAAAHAPPPQLLPFGHHRAFYASATAANTAGAGFDAIRVVLPPSAMAAAAGVWFVLQAALHQREPFLPQIPRNYLRIKDGRVTVRLLTKYLANKLGLDDESEVEITCRGRQLLPILTLQHVRDSIWCQRDAVSPSFASDISTADHIMVLQYGRRP